MTELRNDFPDQRSEIPVLRFDYFEGMEIQRVSVRDMCDEDRNLASKESTQIETGLVNDLLHHNPDFLAPEVKEVDGKKVLFPNNDVAAWMYDNKPALETWRTNLVPNAIALTALYEAESWTLPSGEPVDEATRNYFIHSLDAVGIRTRAEIMSDIAAQYPETDGNTTQWTSIACGAAIPVLNALDRIRGNGSAGDVDLKLLDINPDTLQHAKQKAREREFVEGKDFELLEKDIIKELIVSDNLVQELGPESQQLVDMLGIFEYIPDDFNGFKSAAAFLENAFKLVKPGGALVAGNMLDTHPQIDFNQRAIGWPKIYPRTIAEIHTVITDAGIDPTNVTMKIPEDGIYAVFEIRKPAEFDLDIAA